MDSSSSPSEGQTYAIQSGYYTRIGNRVLFNLRLRMTGLGTLTTTQNARIGLPIVSSNDAGNSSACCVGDVYNMSFTAGYSVQAYVAPNSDYISMQLTDVSGGLSGLLLSEFTASGEIAVSGHYKI